MIIDWQNLQGYSFAAGTQSTIAIQDLSYPAETAESTEFHSLQIAL